MCWERRGTRRCPRGVSAEDALTAAGLQNACRDLRGEALGLVDRADAGPDAGIRLARDPRLCRGEDAHVRVAKAAEAGREVLAHAVEDLVIRLDAGSDAG